MEQFGAGMGGIVCGLLIFTFLGLSYFLKLVSDMDWCGGWMNGWMGTWRSRNEMRWRRGKGWAWEGGGGWEWMVGFVIVRKGSWRYGVFPVFLLVLASKWARSDGWTCVWKGAAYYEADGSRVILCYEWWKGRKQIKQKERKKERKEKLCESEWRAEKIGW